MKYHEKHETVKSDEIVPSFDINEENKARINPNCQDKNFDIQNDIESQQNHKELLKEEEILALGQIGHAPELLDEDDRINLDPIIESYNNKALLELPGLESFNEPYQDIANLAESSDFQEWYNKSWITFANIDPVYKNYHFPKTDIIQRFRNMIVSRRLFYFGEVNDKGKPEGMGLKIVPFVSI